MNYLRFITLHGESRLDSIHVTNNEQSYHHHTQYIL